METVKLIGGSRNGKTVCVDDVCRSWYTEVAVRGVRCIERYDPEFVECACGRRIAFLVWQETKPIFEDDTRAAIAKAEGQAADA